MKRVSLTMIIAIVVPIKSWAWFCDEASSQRIGQIYQVCGVAKNKDEQVARQQALDAAFTEFATLCEKDDTCRGFETSVDPQRVDCKKINGESECRRMVEIEVSRKKKMAGVNSPIPSGEATIFIGQSKEALLTAIGYPSQVIDASKDGSGTTQILNYLNNSICVDGRSCSVVVKGDRVERYSGIKPTVTDELTRKPSGLINQIKNVFGQ